MFSKVARADEVFDEGFDRCFRRLYKPGPRGGRPRYLSAINRGVITGYWAALDRCESPAEKIFLAAAVWSIGGEKWIVPLLWPFDGKMPVSLGLVIAPQHHIGRYRVDFAIYAGSARLVVEIDGHAFHEKTKEQAAHDKRRDRALQQDGWNVFHFTGSEVWNDPFGCCDDINQFIKAS